MTDRARMGKTREKKRFPDKILHELFILLGFFVRHLNRSGMQRMAEAFGDFVFYVLKPRRRLVEGNLTLAFPEKSKKEIIRIARQVYRNQTVNLFETLRLPLLKNKKDAEELIDIDVDDFLKRIRRQNGGSVVVSAHFGNWELMGICIGLLVSPITVVAQRLKNKKLNDDLEHIRSLHGNRVIYRARALRGGLALLDEGGILTILGDQADPKGGFVMDFLGRKASVYLGPAFLALKARAPLCVVLCRRQQGGKYVLDIEEIETSGLVCCKDDIKTLTRRCTKVIEKYIYKYPEQWFWVHNRWKKTNDRS